MELKPTSFWVCGKIYESMESINKDAKIRFLRECSVCAMGILVRIEALRFRRKCGSDEEYLRLDNTKDEACWRGFLKQTMN
jgi:hypothetical protein